MIFQRINLAGWRQFKQLDIELHPRLTVITGANGAGKSTVLNILSQHFGWQRPYLSTPQKNRKNGQNYYQSGLRRRRRPAQPVGHPGAQPEQFGSIYYVEGAPAQIMAHDNNSVQYSLGISGQQPIRGVHIPSHRPYPFYQQVGNIPTNPLNLEQAYNNYFSENVQRLQGGHTQFSPIYRLKESLISMATFGAGNEFVEPNPAALKAYLDFEQVLKHLLPESLGFEKISIRTPDVVLSTRTGDFLLDSSSGGIMAIVDLAWQIHLFSLSISPLNGDRTFVVTIDEPENHLHPLMQRSLIGDLLAAFPTAQFVIATHSPFMVSSVKDSNVYVLNYDQDDDTSETSEEFGMIVERGRKVVSQKLDTINRAGTASEILREVLGLPATIPEWVEEGIKEVVNEFRGAAITEVTLRSFRERLETLGFAELYPQALSDLVA